MAEEEKKETKKSQKVYQFSITENDIKINDFLEKWKKGLPSSVTPLTPGTFYEVEDPDYFEGTNLDRVWAQYDALEKINYKGDYSGKNLPYIKVGTSILLPIQKISMELQKISKQGQFMSQGSFKAFWTDYQKKIKSTINYQDNESETKEDALVNSKIIPQSIRVWIYIKAIEKIIDISAFIMSCTTAKVANTGTFTLSVVPVRGQDSPIKFSNGYYENYNITTTEGIQVKDFLEKYVTQNDIVFIRFEKLKIEKEALMQGTEDSLEISTTNLVNAGENYNVWDMIGFVDVCSTTHNAKSTDLRIDITGRDFTKMFVEDGSYFIPLHWVKGRKDLWFYLGDQSSDIFKRNVLSGEYQYFFHYGFRGIKETIWFVINILSTIGIVPDDLFSAYKDKRTTSYTIDTGDEKQSIQEVKGFWQIVKIFFDDKLEKRTLVDPSFANPDGTLMDFVQKTCQSPFVEVLFDTYIDTMDIVIRQPPFNKEAIEGIVSGEEYVTIKTSNFIESSLSYDDRVYSSYRLFPQDAVVGADDITSLAFVPIIYLNEMAKYFGNKKCEVQDIYIAANALSGANGTKNLNSMAATMLNDLLFVVESNVYLPFTRKGTLVLNGDRRIKVGTFVYNESTDELFYVTGVTQTMFFSNEGVERQTSLQVERGMYMPILKGTFNKEIKNNVEGTLETGNGKASYFKIVEIDKIKEDVAKAEAAAQSDDTKTSGLGQTPINISQFEYFLKRKMFKSK